MVSTPQRLGSESNTRVIARKLEDVLRDLIPLIEQAKAAGSLNGAQNGRKLNNLLEDIRDATMGYQVCMSNCLFLSRLMLALDLVAARHL